MLHAIIISVLILVFGILGLVVNPMGKNPLNIIGFFLSIPAAIVGANMAISAQKSEAEQKRSPDSTEWKP